jgi:hypothetical protein
VLSLYLIRIKKFLVEKAEITGQSCAVEQRETLGCKHQVVVNIFGWARSRSRGRLILFALRLTLQMNGRV